MPWSQDRQRRFNAVLAFVGLVSRLVPRRLRQLPSLYAVQRTKPLVPPRFLQGQHVDAA
jgi:uncharacterized protein (DUF2236 family)